MILITNNDDDAEGLLVCWVLVFYIFLYFMYFAFSVPPVFFLIALKTLNVEMIKNEP